MRKFLQKYKHTSLITGALTIAVLSGLGGAFWYKINVAEQQTQRR